MPRTYTTKGHSKFGKGQRSVRVDKFANNLEDVTDPKNLTEFLFLNRDLTREEFEAKVLETGYRIMLKTLVSQACSGDTKALDLGLKRCDLHFSQHRKPAKEDDAKPSPSYKPRSTE